LPKLEIGVGTRLHGGRCNWGSFRSMETSAIQAS